VPANWAELRTLILQKYGRVDDDDIRIRLPHKNWGDCGCGTRFNPGEAWTRCQHGGVASNNGESIAEDQLGDSGAKICDCLVEYIH
jgi:hypothetical protein